MAKTASKDLKLFYSLKEVVEDLLDEAYAEAPNDYIPTLQVASAKLKEAKSVEDLIEIFDLIGMGRNNAYVYLKALA